MEIFSNEKIDLIENSEFLKNVINDKVSKEVVYRLTFENLDQVNDFKKKIENLDKVKKINLDIV